MPSSFLTRRNRSFVAFVTLVTFATPAAALKVTFLARSQVSTSRVSTVPGLGPIGPVRIGVKPLRPLRPVRPIRPVRPVRPGGRAPGEPPPPGEPVPGEELPPGDEGFSEEGYFEDFAFDLPTEWDDGGAYFDEAAFDESGGGFSAVGGGGIGPPTSGGIKTKTEAVPEGGWHASSRLSLYDQQNDDPAGRSVRDPGDGFLNESMLSFDQRPDGRPVTQAQLLARSTDDHEIYGTGPLTRAEGVFYERALDQHFSIRVGDVLPQFSRYSLQQAGRGLLISRLTAEGNESTQLSLVAAEVQHEEGPSFRRNAIGFRGGRSWQFGNKSRLAAGGQFISYRDVESSQPLPRTATAFPDDEVLAADLVFDHPWGVHAEAEVARSEAQVIAPDGTWGARRGNASREHVAVTRSGRSVTLEHERLDVTFDAPQSSATPDVERQSVGAQLPIFGERLAWSSSYQRTYNDVRSIENRRLDGRTHRTGLQSRPFPTHKNRYVAGLAVGAGLQYTRQRSEDRTTVRDGREVTCSVNENAGRLSAGFEYRTSLDEDLVALENGREPHHWAYQASYELPFGRKDHGRVRPSLSVGHDRDRNLASFLEDRANQFSAGFTGNWGPRLTFGFTRDESTQRQVAAARRSLSRTHRGDVNYRLDPDGNWLATLAVAWQENFDSSQATLAEDRVLVSCYRRW